MFTSMTELIEVNKPFAEPELWIPTASHSSRV